MIYQRTVPVSGALSTLAIINLISIRPVISQIWRSEILIDENAPTADFSAPEQSVL
jgi:hypothetical protein